jgi:hypothetical protein
MKIFKARVKVLYLSRKFENLQRFSRENHDDGGHEHGVYRGFPGVSFHLRRSPQGVGRLCVLQENPHFWVPTIKVRPPDGTFEL